MALSVLYPDEGSDKVTTVDIVAVHGEGGDAFETWTHPETGAFWLKDFLPQLFPSARILTFSYADIDLFGASMEGISSCAHQLLTSLSPKRKIAMNNYRPLIFVAHSLGGFLVMHALLRLGQRFRPIFKATVGVIFLGTPLRGRMKSFQASELARAIERRMFLTYLSRFTQHDRQEDIQLLKLSEDFVHTFWDCNIVSFCETQLDTLTADAIRETSRPGQGSANVKSFLVDADLASLCRFKTKTDPIFMRLDLEIYGMMTASVHKFRAQTQPTLEVPTFQDIGAPHDRIAAVAASMDGSTLAVVFQNFKVGIWDFRTTAKVQELKVDHEEYATMAINQDGSFLAIVSTSHEVSLWDLKTGHRTQKLKRIDEVSKIALSQDSSQLAIVSGYDEISIWDANMDQEIHNLGEKYHSITAMEFSAEHMLTIVFADGRINTYDTKTGKIAMRFRRYSDIVHKVAFSQDGSLLTVASSIASQNIKKESMISTWELKTGKLLSTSPQDHFSEIQSMALSQDGLLLAIAHKELRSSNAISIRDSRKGFKVQDFKWGYIDDIEVMAFNQDGSLIAFASQSRNFVVWTSTDCQAQKLGGRFYVERTTNFQHGDQLSATTQVSAIFGTYDHPGTQDFLVQNVQEPSQKDTTADKLRYGDRCFSSQYKVQWEGEYYMRLEFEPSESVANISVLWETNKIINLTDCRRFADCGFPDVFEAVTYVLKSLHQAQSGTSIMYATGLRQGSRRWIELAASLTTGEHASLEKMQVLEISLKSNWEKTQKIVQDILIRLSAVLRPAVGSLSWSQAYAEEESGFVNIKLSPLKCASIEACWRPLFPNKVIAIFEGMDQFRSDSPRDIGLELELSHMTSLCGADFPIELDGGICLSGTYTLLVPIETRHTTEIPGSCLVWHLFTADYLARQPSKARRKLWSIWAEWRQHNQWHKVQSLDELRGFTRHILAWTKQAAITLGSSIQPYRLRRTGAKTRHEEPTETTFNFGMSLGYSGAGVNASLSVKLGRTEINRFHDRNGNTGDWLHESIEEQILLYNPLYEQAWLVPKIAMVHHLALERMKYVIARKGITNYEVPYIDATDTDPTRIFEELCLILDHPIPHHSDGQIFLRDALHSILCALDQFERSNILRGPQRDFMGFEAYDAVHQTPYFRVKYANTSNHSLALKRFGGWVHLLEDVPIVLFYRGIEDPIVPLPEQENNNMRHPLIEMPMNKNCLAASIRSLLELGKKYNDRPFDCSQLAENAYWHCTKTFREHHSGYQSCTDEEFQAVWTSVDANAPLRRKLKEYHNGAVIFIPGTGISEVLEAKLHF